MCGLAGMIDAGLDRDEGEPLLERMLESIRHRGPDATSTWIDMPVWLGHNRLSIIDLSDLANQPMVYDDLVIVHNGEVYNYLEIRAELEAKGYRFTTQSDTEVILAAYKEWGSECVTRFVGMWAFAIWDRSKRELFCSRDRFGIKPFYYIHSGDRFYFGSEYKPLKLSPLFDATLNRRHVRRGLQIGAIAYRDETYYECLKALPERSNLRFKDGQITVWPYWDLTATRSVPGTFDERTQRLRELFRDSIRLHLRSDVPLGGMLSGGLDSASIASMIGTDFPEVPYKTFTVYYDGWKKMDERPWAQQVTAAYPSIEPVTFTPTDDDLAESYDAIVRAHDTPVPSSPAVSCYFIMQTAARSKLKVMLDGQGGDESFAGYVAAYDRHIAGHLKQLQLRSAIKAFRDFRSERSADLRAALRVAITSLIATFAGEQALYLRHLQPSIADLLWTSVPLSLPRVPGPRLNEYAYNLMFGFFLPSLLHYGDRMSMAFSVECRVPFLDHRLVEFAYALDADDKIRDGRSKYIFRKAVDGIVPPGVLNRKGKQPFLGGELNEWLRGPLRYLIDRPLELDGLDLTTPQRASRLVQEFKDGNMRLAPMVWSLAGLNYWLRRQ